MTKDTNKYRACGPTWPRTAVGDVFELLDEIDRLNAVNAELMAHLVVANGVIDTWGRALNRMYAVDL